MFIRPCYRRKNGKRHAYWALVESYRTGKGPRQRIVGYLGGISERGRKGAKRAAEGNRISGQTGLFPERENEADWVEIDAHKVRVENPRGFGGPWLAMRLVKMLGLDDFLAHSLPRGKEKVGWDLTSLILIASRLLNPSSELDIAERFYKSTALPEILGVRPECVEDTRLYRGLDRLLEKKDELEIFLKERLGTLFKLEYDILFYDITSTYFEGAMPACPMAKRGYSRDRRPDCRQVVIALVVSRCGMPLGYEIFDGNRADVTSVEEMVGLIEKRYGRSDRIWAMDRGMVSDDNLQFMRREGRRYIVGTPKSLLARHEAALLKGDWLSVREGVEVKTLNADVPGETFILCRSQDRGGKEQAMREVFSRRLEEGLGKLARRCEKRKCAPDKISESLGRLRGRNSRASRFYYAKVHSDDGRARLEWRLEASREERASPLDGCYILRTNIQNWRPEDLWEAYIHLTEAEEAFRIHKSDLRLRPVWHQKEERVRAHILVCFLAYALWKTLARLCSRAGLGDEPRRVLKELSLIQLVDVIIPTKAGAEFKRACVTIPTPHQRILLERLGMKLPTQWTKYDLNTKL
ncbi:MAG: IS1634 family transposase [Planctomycetota bacterium]|nr:IS1634 family transposase [Planctomycetota bacterium]